MVAGTKIPFIVGCTLLAASTAARADTRTATVEVTATVVAPCEELSVQTQAGDTEATLEVRCSRGQRYGVEIARARVVRAPAGGGTRGEASSLVRVTADARGQPLVTEPATGTAQRYSLPPGSAEGGAEAQAVVVTVSF